ncbi:transcriptional regulator, GntR family [Streptoalloteichus hindustanus]|uniref:Transcriptional regulator, GntR family n=1 Tax=Streptoalloteichus hindustanus TaxID=2017 RepID=A0A1M4U3H7_STRHI|nr:transcriptional regulator, GntR family [Streptoalloteichus hindustanus]
MEPTFSPGGRVSGATLARLLGAWRQGGRRGSADLAGAIRVLVLDGRLTVGTRLPAERELAEALGASRTLVTTAMDRLRDDGVVASRRGAGSWIARPVAADRPSREQPVSASDVLDLSCASPPALPELATALDTARRRMPAEFAQPGYLAQGLLELRERIAERYTARGLPTHADQVLITNGAQHAFALALRMLVGPGDRVLMENPSYPNAIDAVRASYARPVAVAMTDEGWDLDGLEVVLRQAAPRLAFLMPDFHNPTGGYLDAAGRERLGAALRRTRTPVFVDETLAELALEPGVGGAPPLAAFAEDLVISAGSASKLYWGGLRLGWVRASADLVRRMVAVRPVLDLGSPVLEQVVLSELFAVLPGVVECRQREFRRLRDVLIAELRARCPGWEIPTPVGGLALWCRLDGPVSTRLAVTAEGLGVHVAPGSRFAVTGGLEHYVRLPFTLAEEQLVEAARRLAVAASSVGGPGLLAEQVPLAELPVT